MANLYNTADDWDKHLNSLHLKGRLLDSWDTVRDWMLHDLLETDTLYELAVMAVVFGFAMFCARWSRTRLQKRWAEHLKPGQHGSQWYAEFLRLLTPVYFMIMLWPIYVVTSLKGLDNDLMNLCANAMGAWVLIRLVTAVLFKPFWAKVFSGFIWALAALQIFGLLGLTLHLLDSVRFQAGHLQLSLLSILESLLFFGILLRLGIRLGSFVEDRMATSGDLEPSTRTLIGILLKTALIIVICIVSLEIIGVEMDMLTFFSGALGFGLGIGLRTVFSNLISGIIIMLDKSIRPGDVIWIGEVFGKVTALRARYASVVTRDGQEFLIPNEDLISQQVINCSYSSKEVRLKVPVGVAYGSDVDLAMALCEKAATGVPRIVNHPAPASRLLGLGDSAINLELRFWVNDPENGTANVKTKVLKRVIELFEENGVEIPFPQRDVRILHDRTPQLGDKPGGDENGE
ncbi:MAG: mechanosensitive ion channel [Desulfarculaceae bacterium]|nr:mechanosensitive ion channel [Desulfarculaceae bacterium]MCF8073861.1 mechanosensitive ion channel [Desulfarculaceae bacterium]MCF8102841.1 mechanosensitive ion channel [Desulfarculaceae bacterium]MCF8116285.1 mechanosensitive ion channel [Desulfarculaceae bacterium]